MRSHCKTTYSTWYSSMILNVFLLSAVPVLHRWQFVTVLLCWLDGRVVCSSLYKFSLLSKPLIIWQKYKDLTLFTDWKHFTKIVDICLSVLVFKLLPPHHSLIHLPHCTRSYYQLECYVSLHQHIRLAQLPKLSNYLLPTLRP